MTDQQHLSIVPVAEVRPSVDLETDLREIQEDVQLLELAQQELKAVRFTIIPKVKEAQAPIVDISKRIGERLLRDKKAHFSGKRSRHDGKTWEEWIAQIEYKGKSLSIRTAFYWMKKYDKNYSAADESLPNKKTKQSESRTIELDRDPEAAESGDPLTLIAWQEEAKQSPEKEYCYPDFESNVGYEVARALLNCPQERKKHLISYLEWVLQQAKEMV